MALIEQAPHVKLLLKIQALLLDVDWQDRVGLPADEEMTIRHARNRNPVRGEKNCITIVFVGDEPQQAEQNRNAGETTRELQVDFQVDLKLATEISEDDPTGLDQLSRVAGAALQAMKADGEDLYLDGMADYVTHGSIDPDEKSQSDQGRLVRAISVLYRVRSDDANVLLAAGET